MFCNDFKALVSEHLRNCQGCRDSLAGALKYISDVPLVGMLLKKTGTDVTELTTIFKGEFSDGRIKKD